MNNEALLLGYPPLKSDVADVLTDLGFSISHTENPISDLSSFAVIVSFGYRHLIPRQVLTTVRGLILNLHISLLPHNRGAHPLFWACMENSPTGVSIHHLDQGIDTGDIYSQEQVTINKEDWTFREAHSVLITAASDLFSRSIRGILDGKTGKIPQPFTYAARKTQDLPTQFSGWDALVEYETSRLREVLGWTSEGDRFVPPSQPSRKSG